MYYPGIQQGLELCMPPAKRMRIQFQLRLMRKGNGQPVKRMENTEHCPVGGGKPEQSNQTYSLVRQD